MSGVRKKRKIADDVEFYAYTRVERSIRRADVVLFLVDAATPASQVDKRLANLISSEFKPCVVVVNKWDLARERASTSDYDRYLTKTLPELSYAPIAALTAKDSVGVQALVDLATSLFKQAQGRVTTARLNQALEQATAEYSAAPKQGPLAIKIYYGTQVATNPPTVVLFVNRPELISDSYRRYLLNRFREMLPFGEIPIRLIFRQRT